MRRIRFLGLFDTVNSVPRFENAWMKRNGFPYTARSTAKVIRHAVSIDERRAKFRQDLISGSQLQKEDKIKQSAQRHNTQHAAQGSRQDDKLLPKKSSQGPIKHLRRKYSDLSRPQDIGEVWFAGGHADIGGGWMKSETEIWPLSHAPLVWMVHEAERAGLRFDAT